MGAGKSEDEFAGVDPYHRNWEPTGRLRWFRPERAGDNDLMLQQEVVWKSEIGFSLDPLRIWRDIPKVFAD